MEIILHLLVAAAARRAAAGFLRVVPAKWQDSKIGRNDFQYVACDVGKNVRDRSTDNTETTCGKKITFPVEPKPLCHSSTATAWPTTSLAPARYLHTYCCSSSSSLVFILHALPYSPQPPRLLAHDPPLFLLLLLLLSTPALLNSKPS